MIWLFWKVEKKNKKLFFISFSRWNRNIEQNPYSSSYSYTASKIHYITHKTDCYFSTFGQNYLSCSELCQVVCLHCWQFSWEVISRLFTFSSDLFHRLRYVFSLNVRIPYFIYREKKSWVFSLKRILLIDSTWPFIYKEDFNDHSIGVLIVFLDFEFIKIFGLYFVKEL